METRNPFDFDYVIIGSGFGGSVSALRLTEKGYKVVVLEKGKWFKQGEDFPKTNWNLKKWMWVPSLGMKGFFKLTFYRHVAVLSGVGVGGGSLVYANTLPIPQSPFFNSGSWSGLCDWEEELKPYYAKAGKMLGATRHPHMSRSDTAMQKAAEEMGIPETFKLAEVSIYFGKPNEIVPDPFFNGKGPERSGCNLCGGCMTGCRHNAKNTLDKNYLHLAMNLGCEVRAESLVMDVVPQDEDGTEGYVVKYRHTFNYISRKQSVSTKAVIFAGGVLGTLSLMLKLKKKSLPNLSKRLGKGVRTNSESLIGVTTFDRDVSYSEGIAIGSIIQMDEHRSVEPVKYSEGSGFWRLLMTPMIKGGSLPIRLTSIFKDLITRPIANLRTFWVDDWSKRTQILLYMESIESTLTMRRSWMGNLKTSVEGGKAPTAFNPIAQEVAKRIESIIHGKAMVLASESIMAIPTTAHILGGACMGDCAENGVVDKNHRVFNYKNMMICDGSVISANIGVNPSLTITALTERAMDQIPQKGMINSHMIHAIGNEQTSTNDKHITGTNRGDHQEPTKLLRDK